VKIDKKDILTSSVIIKKTQRHKVGYCSNSILAIVVVVFMLLNVLENMYDKTALTADFINRIDVLLSCAENFALVLRRFLGSMLANIW
jgi:hypothetical protein